eukprot:g3855.t1
MTRVLCLLPLFVAATIVVARPANSSLSRAEWHVLRQLFLDTGGGEGAWANATGWNVSAYEDAQDPCDGCSWFGIYDWRGYDTFGLDVPACDANATAGAPRVQVLSLTANPSAPSPASNGLRGGLGAGLGRLAALRVLLVAGNEDLTGPVPDIATLTKLQVLTFANNNALAGTIPDLAALTALQLLALYNSSLTGALPSLATLTALQVLSLYNNALTGRIPELAALTALQVLQLYNNSLTGTVPGLAALTALNVLGLAHNALTGTIPSLAALTSLGGLSLNDNSLTGCIPGRGLPPSLVALDLSNNALTGSIPGTLAALTALQQLYLYNNSVGGTIPPLLGLTALRQLLLHSNQLRGAVPSLPRSVLAGLVAPGDDDAFGNTNHWALNTDPALTLFDNGRLSCALPDAGASPGAGLVAVVAFGNRFSAPAPRWVRRETRDAALLFAPQHAAWEWVAGYIGGGALLLTAVASWAHGRAATRGGSGCDSGGSCADGDRDARVFVALLREGAVALAALSCLACGTLLPAYLAGANYYQCGELLMHTSLAYLADAPRAAQASVVFACVLVLASSVVFGQLLRGRLQRARGAGRSRSTRASAPRALVRAASTPRGATRLLVWLAVTLLLSTPTVLYVVALYLPADNVLGIGAVGALALRRGVPLLLALINAVLLPALTRLLVRRMRGLHRRPALAAAVSARLLLLARVLMTIVIPVSAALLLSAECGGRWTALWSVCSGGSATATRYNVTTGCHPANSSGCAFYIPGGPDGSTPVLAAAQLCTRGTARDLASGRCARGVLEVLVPLFAEKLAIAACLQPACLLLFFESGAASWMSKALYGRHDETFGVGLDLEFAAALSQMELALVYGVALPLMLPIAALSMCTHRAVFCWLLRRGRGGRGGAVALPCGSPPLWWLSVSVALQAALAAWVFAATQGAAYGWAMGVVASGAVAANVTGVRWRCARARGRTKSAITVNERGLRLTIMDAEAPPMSDTGYVRMLS